MVYAYIRVSTGKQTVKNQRYEIERYVRAQGLKVDHWVSETVSGTKSAQERKLGNLLKRLKRGDTLILPEISRLGRNLMQIMGVLNICILKRVAVRAIKEDYVLDDNINSQILAFAFGLVAQIERELISQRTREGLARRKAEGQKLGRKHGQVISKYKLSGKEEVIREMIAKGKSKAEICRRLKCSYRTLVSHLKRIGPSV